MTFFLFTIIFVALGVFLVLMKSKKETQQHESQEPTHFELLNENGDPFPKKLLDLETTTLAQRQRAYGRGFRLQQRYDILQRQAELAGDLDTLEAIRTNTYNGPLPELKCDEPNVQELQYFCVKDKGYHVSVWPKDQKIPDYLEFEIAGMSYRGNLGDYTGEHVGTLEPEPDNPYDANAIKILAEDGHHVGYVPKDMTGAVREFASLPCTCYFYIGGNDGTYYSDAYISNISPNKFPNTPNRQ